MKTLQTTHNWFSNCTLKSPTFENHM